MAAILGRAGIGHRRPKDLRDSFASQLLSAGIQLGCVSQQLVHADFAITARHCAPWVGGDLYRQAMTLEPGEVPADLLARFGWPQSGPTRSEAADVVRENVSEDDDLMVAQARIELATPAFSVRCSTN